MPSGHQASSGNGSAAIQRRVNRAFVQGDFGTFHLPENRELICSMPRIGRMKTSISPTSPKIRGNGADESCPPPRISDRERGLIFHCKDFLDPCFWGGAALALVTRYFCCPRKLLPERGRPTGCGFLAFLLDVHTGNVVGLLGQCRG